MEASAYVEAKGESDVPISDSGVLKRPPSSSPSEFKNERQSQTRESRSRQQSMGSFSDNTELSSLQHDNRNDQKSALYTPGHPNPTYTSVMSLLPRPDISTLLRHDLPSAGPTSLDNTPSVTQQLLTQEQAMSTATTTTTPNTSGGGDIRIVGDNAASKTSSRSSSGFTKRFYCKETDCGKSFTTRFVLSFYYTFN